MLKKHIHLENTPRRIHTSHILQFILWKVHRQITRRLIDLFFYLVTLTFDP